MIVRRMPGSETSVEYGLAQNITLNYQIIIPADEAGNKPLSVLHDAVRQQPQLLGFESVRILQKERIDKGAWVFHATCTKPQEARRHDAFVYRYSTGLVSEQRGTDILGNLNTVAYPAGDDDARVTALVDVTTPAIEITCTGIRDLGADTEFGDQAIILQLTWLNKVNETTWKGNPPRTVKCVSVQVDPKHKSASQHVAQITFRFSVLPGIASATNGVWTGTHDPWIYWESGGDVPADDDYRPGGADDYSASYRQTLQYYPLDFNTTFPLGDPTPEDAP
ncbi:MAG: hypothetical protein M0Q49_04735 [Porticoccaceae bacterium]|nr:hypothetical protein [Porticoccaceae bacterium]